MQCLEQFDRDSALRETIYLALRTRRGVSDTRTAPALRLHAAGRFSEAVAATAPWLSQDAGRWSLTPAGWLLFDRLILAFSLRKNAPDKIACLPLTKGIGVVMLTVLLALDAKEC